MTIVIFILVSYSWLEIYYFPYAVAQRFIQCCAASGNVPTAGLMNFSGGNLPQQNIMGLNNPFAANTFNGLPQAGGNPMLGLGAQQQLFNLGGNGMNGVLAQQNESSGMGGSGGGIGGLAGIDLTKINLSDPNNLALVQQLLGQQSGGIGQNLGALNSLDAANQKPHANGDASSSAQTNNVTFQMNNEVGQPPAAEEHSEKVGQSAIV